MDITRNWRLKTSRSQMMATRCPQTGAVILPQQPATAPQPVQLYTFEMPHSAETEADYAQAAR